MKTTIPSVHANPPSPLGPPKESTPKNTRPSGKAAAKAAPKSQTPKKSIWHSVWFGLATGVLAFVVNILPEKVGKFLSQVFSPLVKVDNPFVPDGD